MLLNLIPSLEIRMFKPSRENISVRKRELSFADFGWIRLMGILSIWILPKFRTIAGRIWGMMRRFFIFCMGWKAMRGVAMLRICTKLRRRQVFAALG